jgi:hypothetical protein
MTAAFACLIFSLIAPGSGQIFNGQYLKGAVFAFLFIFGPTVLLPLVIRIFKFKDDVKVLKIIYYFNVFYPVFLIIAVIDAAYAGMHTLHTFKGAVIALICAFVFASAHKGLRNGFIIYSMSGRRDIAQYILVKKG